MKPIQPVTLLLLLSGLVAGCGDQPPASDDKPRPMENQTREIAYWVAPMDPSYRHDGPGKSPMGMDLKPVYVDDLVEPGQVQIHPSVQQAMNLRTDLVERNRLFRRIDTVGRIQVDESTVHHLHPRVDGWIHELDIDAAGDVVETGQRLFTLYSPELVNVQEEFLQALRSGQTAMIQATQQRLERLDIEPAVIERIKRTGEPLVNLPWYARHNGYVAELNVRHGMYVNPGLMILTMADPDSVWLIADVFAGQIDWLAIGQRVEVNLSSKPAKRYSGQVDFIYPELAEKTRTARVRIVLNNEDRSLRPGDWASLSIFGGPKENLLIIPTEALIRTGTEIRVVVQDDDQTFSIRQVHPGLESGPYTEILHGLDEGERVVVSGQFLIDSEASIRAGHSRISSHDH